MQEFTRLFKTNDFLHIILTVILLTAIIGNGYSHPPDPVRLLSWDENTLVLELSTGAVSLERMEIDDQVYHLPRIPGWPSLEIPGKPDLPCLRLPIALPPDKEIAVIDLIALRVESFSVPAIAPAPTLVTRYQDQEPYPAFTFKPDSQVYNRNAFFPESYHINALGKLAGVRVVQAEIFPVTLNPVTGEMRVVTSARVQIRFKTAFEAKTEQIAPGQNWAFEQLQRLVINPDQITASSKNIPATSVQTSSQTPSFNQVAGRMVIEREGMYRLTYADLQRAGLPVAELVPKTLRLSNKGIEQALYVAGAADGHFDPDDYIDFYGQPNRGDTSYYDLYTDQNVYWLSWGGADGLRFQEAAAGPVSGPVQAYYLETLHLEEENKYYSGDDDAAIWNTEICAGEGWVWEYLFPKDEFSTTALLSQVHYDTAKSLIRIRVRGTTLTPINPDHYLKFYLNNQLLGEVLFNDRETITFTTRFPTQWLISGANRVKIQSVGTSAPVDQCYLDWIEIQYPRQFQVDKDQLIFEPAQSGLQNFSLRAFKARNIAIYNPAQRIRLANFQIVDTLRISASVFSAGVNDGNSAKIVINGVTELLGGSRGLNVVMLDPMTGGVILKQNFDTYSSTVPADSLAALIERAPDQTPVFIAVRDEASRNLSARARAAIRSLGSVLIDSLGYKDSFALIGKKNLGAGQAYEGWRRAGQGAVTVTGELVIYNTGRNIQLLFSADFTARQRYIACSDSGMLKPTELKLYPGANLQASSNGADYIIISHKDFLTSANELAQYRSQHNGFRTRIVDIADIYDEFNDGLKNPVAIQTFLWYARNNWTAPAPRYLCLLGDASSDHKMNDKSSTKIDYVPSYGNPVSDTWLVCLDGPGDLLPDLNVGRLPVESDAEAQVLIDKIKRYEAQPTDIWNKLFLFVAGGTNSLEHRVFESQNQFLLDNYIKPAPIAGRGEIISKAKYESTQLSAAEAITSRLNDGRLWLNFIGHGASSTWDLIYNDSNIDDLNNADRLPFITSMTCHTARFANPQYNSFGETFIKPSNRGCIGFWGTTGWGFTDQDERIINLLFETVFRDRILDTGEALTQTKIKYSARSIPSIRVLSTFYQFSLLGDPALKLALAPKPDLAFRHDAITLQPPIPTEDDSLVTIEMRIWNFGLALTDSFELVGSDLFNGQELEGVLGSYRLRPIAFSDSLQLVWKIKDTIGRHILRFEINPTGQIDEFTRQNNLLELPVDVFPSQLTISQPYRYQMVGGQHARLTVNNPSEPAQRLYYFELDTLSSFSSLFLLRSDPIPEGLLVTRWHTPALPLHQEFFWRCRYYDGKEYSNWVESVFYTADASEPFDWQQKGKTDLAQNSFVNAYVHPDGYVTQVPIITRIKAESQGLYQSRTHADITLNGTSVMVTARGHNLAVFDQNTGSLLASQIFDTWLNSSEADRMANFIAQIPDGRVVAVAIRDDGSRSMNEAAFTALESIGSRLCRQVGYHDSYAIVGAKGKAAGTAVEQLLQVGTGMASAQDSLLFLPEKAAMLSPVIGPASQWNAIRLETFSPTSDLFLDILGFDKQAARWDSIKLNLSGQLFNLAAISAEKYPKIQLQARFQPNSNQQPVKFSAWQVDYVSVPDLAIGVPSVSLNGNSLLVGESLHVNATILNVGLKDAKNFQVQFTITDPESGKIDLGKPDTVAILKVDSSLQILRQWQSLPTTGVRRLEIHVDPHDLLTELFEFNNVYAKTIEIRTDTMMPSIAVTFDGREIMAGDYVSVTPRIIGHIKDNNALGFMDTSAVHVLLDGNRIRYTSGLLRLEPFYSQNQPGSDIVATLTFTPELNQGHHTLEIFIRDTGGNKIYHRNDFQVETRMQIEQVLNYPNPFKNDTWFCFYLTQPAQESSVKIYTVAGRLIQQINLGSVAAGYHQIYWDGLDADGDELANGVYLYRILAKGPAGRTEAIERLVVMR